LEITAVTLADGIFSSAKTRKLAFSRDIGFILAIDFPAKKAEA
jgi:hypothetical protein